MKLFGSENGGILTITERFLNSAELMVPLFNSSVIVPFKLCMCVCVCVGVCVFESGIETAKNVLKCISFPLHKYCKCHC